MTSSNDPNQIDLLNDDIFNLDVDEVLSNWDDENSVAEDSEVPIKCLFQNFQKIPEDPENITQLVNIEPLEDKSII